MATRSKRKKSSSSKLQSVESKIELAESKILTIEERQFEYLKLLAYGKNGKGKTRFGATGPKPFIIDCNERGSLSIRHFKDVQIFRIDLWSDIDLAYWYLHAGNHDRETVVIDTTTSLQNLAMKFVLGDEASRDPTKDPEMPSRPVWGKVGELMKTEILKFRNLPMHVIFLAQERRGFSEDEDEAPEVYPEVSPSIRGTLTSAVDIIGRLYVKEVVKKGKKKPEPEYRMLIGPSEVFTTKDRSESGLPRVIRLPKKTNNLARLIERIRKGEK